MKLKPRKIAEAVAEKILMASGYLTSIVIVLIVVFLFREGAGLFDSPAVEQGYVLAVNRANPVQSLTPEQIMQIFDADLTNWSEVGGPDDSILVFRLDDITSYATEQELGADLSRAPQCLSRIVADHPNMIAYLPEQYVAPDFAGKVLGEGRITPASFFAGRQWYPTAAPAPQYGLIPLLAGTLWVSLAAILIALPLGLSVAIYMAELADSRLRRMLKPVIELLAGIPSVVYGFFGLVAVVPLVRDVFDLPVGETGTRRQPDSGDHGAADDHHRRRGYDPHDSPSHARIESGARRDALADDPPGRVAVLGLGHRRGGRAGHRPRGRRNDGRADGNRQRRRRAALAARARADDSRDDRRRAGGGSAGGAHYEALFMLGCILFLAHAAAEHRGRDDFGPTAQDDVNKETAPTPGERFPAGAREKRKNNNERTT